MCKWKCQNGHKGVAALLIDRGADVDKAKNDGWTPLLIAAHVRIDCLTIIGVIFVVCSPKSFC